MEQNWTAQHLLLFWMKAKRTCSLVVRRSAISRPEHRRDFRPYLAKYSLNNDSSPRRNGTLPRVFGTSGSECVSAPKVEDGLVYGVAHSGGSLFGGSSGEFDFVLFAVDVKTGSLKTKAQVGSGATERGVKSAIGKSSIVAALSALLSWSR